MKRLILSVMLLVAAVGMASAQKFALIDMEYILKQIPSYQQANQQMESLSKQWQSQIEAKANEAKKLYEDYQKSANTLSATQKTRGSYRSQRERSGRAPQAIFRTGR